jgi:hypothetical protein
MQTNEKFEDQISNVNEASITAIKSIFLWFAFSSNPNFFFVLLQVNQNFSRIIKRLKAIFLRKD